MADENQAPRRGLGSNDRRRHSSSSNSHTAQYAGNFSGPDTGSRTGQDRYTNGPRHRSQSFQQPGLQQARPGLTFQSRTRFKHNNAHAGNQFRGTNNELSIAALQEFLDSGIDKIEYSEESRYAFIVQLASQSGLERVRQLLEAEYVKTYSVLKPTFEFHCVAFLRILSNDDVLKALSLEQQVRTIYNVVYGFNGERAIPFFGRVIDFLLDFKPNDDDPNCMDQESWAEALHLTSIVFLNTVKMNQSAALQSDLQTMGQQLANISQGSALVPDEVLDSARDNISRIQIILTTGADVPIERHRDDATARNGKPFRSPEEEIIDFPGKLSLSGQPRHDNDHELIDNICILPTVGEIQCDSRKDFLPTKLAYEQKSHHHQEGIQRLVDIQFRLLREDTAGQLRDAARFVIKHWSALIAPTPTPGDWSAKRKLIREGSPTPIRLYFGAQIQRLRFETKTGLEAFIEFDQPRAARRLATVKRHWYWRKSMELRENKAVVALIEKTTEDTNVIFFVVAKRNIPSVAEQSNEDSQSDLTAPVTDLSTNPWRASITLRLVTLSNALEQARLIHIALGYSSALQGQTGLLMVEFPAVIYKNFQGILTCLKHIHKNPTQLPFGKWLAPQLENSAVVGSQRTGSPVPPPAYLRHATLDLSTCFASPGEAGHTYAPLSQRLTFSMSQNPESMINAWAQGSPLDHGQAKAMVSAFSHEISLTQGPPGCGKSYVGVKMVVGLLANKASLGLGPILCICYTNHALDQFLNELLKSGVSNIARIGSPSPMAHINALAFDTYRKVHQVKIPYLSRRITATTTILEDLQREINEICVRIEAGGPMMVYNYLKKELPSKLSEIDRVVLPVNTALEDEERDGTEAFTAWINWIEPNSGPSCERTIEELIVLQAWNLTGDERLQLYLHWHQNAVDQLTQRLQSLVAGFESNKKTLTSLHLERDRMCLGQVNILGITTVGLVNNAELIRALPAKVMICEEAGEVLESHILTALIPSVEHIILIGDHLQLRPKISNRMLSKEYGRDGGKFNFDESLFERLANTRFKYPNEESQSVGIPIGQLNVQRRMHPSISNLVRTTLYPELEDHERTTIYPEVAGIRRRLFWLDHRNYEDPVDLFEAMQSKTNTWEAKMVVSLVVYLAKQGVYKPGEIAVLTPYVNQMRMFMEMFDNIVDYEISQRDLEELEVSDDEDADKSKGRQASVTKSKILDRIRIATVDNFQGEEAEIVIVSLVRSNERKECGFLKTPNRINVLLSRAKHGMYIIGDASSAMNAPMWRDTIALFEQNENFGPKLQLHCPRHPERKTFVGSPQDFEDLCPEGGCIEKCGLRLRCGHICEFKCHPEPLHEKAYCFKDCTKPRDCGHPCRKRCKDPCGLCHEKVFDVELPCGHTAAGVACYQTENLSRVICREMVTKVLPDCNHEARFMCSFSNNPSYKCSQKCGHTLPCGHLCGRKCSDCKGSGTHGVCTTPCGIEFTICQHKCARPCHQGSSCLPCDKPCEIRCKHGKCPNKCGEACIPCAEVCGWECEHQKEKCNLPCAVPCHRLPCHKRCQKLLAKCRHQCPSVCGEKCPPPKYCRECARPGVLERRVDFIALLTYAEVNIDEDPLVFLDCGHFYTTSSLDGLMELNKHYPADQEAGRRSLLLGRARKGCPDCRRPLRDIDRYNRVFKTALLDELTRRFVARSTSEYAELVQQLQVMESGLEQSRQELVQKLDGVDPDTGRKILATHKLTGKNLQRQIKKFIDSVNKTEQPLAKVNDLYASAVAKLRDGQSDGGEMGQSLNFDQSLIQTGLKYRGDCLDAKAKWVMLWDWYTISIDEHVDLSLRKRLQDTIATEVQPATVLTDALRKDCRRAHLYIYAVEASVYFALFSVLGFENGKAMGRVVDAAAEEETRKKAKKILADCDARCRRLQGTLGRLSSVVEDARRMVESGLFHHRVTSDAENRFITTTAILFRGAGDWYYCVNGHPFIVRGDGLAVVEARCPDCNEPVGGRDGARPS